MVPSSRPPHPTKGHAMSAELRALFLVLAVVAFVVGVFHDLRRGQLLSAGLALAFFPAAWDAIEAA